MHEIAEHICSKSACWCCIIKNGLIYSTCYNIFILDIMPTAKHHRNHTTVFENSWLICKIWHVGGMFILNHSCFFLVNLSFSMCFFLCVEYFHHLWIYILSNVLKNGNYFVVKCLSKKDDGSSKDLI